ncbi:hypothetical protein FRUB_03966 [Fimbriiglobus ruber]|uniref:Uncharacterized protein n=1 Tax=Fimbriiglobus ruber TaxID=1908690 RepID=A0A225DTL7_9BACT|nr:hypothetical protein FRUB_03966 [Fimbriiglobus ruber]
MVPGPGVAGPGAPVPPSVLPAGGMSSEVPYRPGTFGSPNLTLSRDHRFLDFFGLSLFSDDANTVVLGEQQVVRDRYFLQAEYLLWWVQSAHVPALATTATGGGFGFLGQPGTETLLGPGSFGATARSGFRVRGGAWLDDCETCGVDGSFFFLGRRTTTAELDSNQYPTIARPFFAPNLNQEFAELVAYPGLSTGTLRTEMTSFLWGADLNARWAVCNTCDFRSEWFAGFRHLNLQEGLTLTENITAGPQAPDPQGTQIVVQDSFQVHNLFYGGQVGWAANRRFGRFDVDARFSVALGVTHQDLDINGYQQVTRPGQATQNFNGGLLAVGPNLGSFSQNKFSVAPEATVNVGYMVTPTLRAFVGYNFLYWSNVIRPGDQIDRVIDLSYVPNFGSNITPNQNRPLPLFTQTGLWAQGIQFGVQLRW